MDHNLRSRQLTHRWRSEEQGILVGSTTVLQDNPALTTRHWDGKSPVRIILDRNLEVTEAFRILDGSVKTIVITQKAATKEDTELVIYETITFESSMIEKLLMVLHKHHITSIIIEGGAQTLHTFISEGLWDEARIFTAPRNIANGLRAPRVTGKGTVTTKYQRRSTKNYCE